MMDHQLYGQPGSETLLHKYPQGVNESKSAEFSGEPSQRKSSSADTVPYALTGVLSIL